MRIVSYNVNGIRAAIKKGLVDWLKEYPIDILCVQETKATPEDVDLTLFTNLGYHVSWYPAQKKGYSGVAVFSKQKPSFVACGTGYEMSDYEGRVIRVDMGELTIVNAYFPSGTSGDERQGYKYQWLNEFFTWIEALKKERPHVILAGGWIDSFRHKNPTETGAYSWWSQRFPSVRLNNKGWRIDYLCTTQALEKQIKDASILPQVKHSDHCPIVIELKK